jgi:hypothetical protein
VNGDGINDLIVHELRCDAAGDDCLGILTRNSNGTNNPQQTILTSASLSGPSALRATRNSKPDIASGMFVLLNTTPGNFPSCVAPNAFEGINVCSPTASSTVSSPVSFKVGAAGQVVMRKAEVWVDGKKLAEQLNGYSNYTFLVKSLTLSPGSHRVVIFAAGWDNSLEEKVFTLKVK